MTWTLVKHSAVRYGDMTFNRAVQVQHIEGTEIDRVRKAGGFIFDTFQAASEAEYAVNYPSPEGMGMLPCCCGRFANMRLEGLMVYLPTGEERDRHG